MKKVIVFLALLASPALAQQAPAAPPSVEEISGSAGAVIDAMQAERNVLLQKIGALAGENAKLKAQINAAPKAAPAPEKK